jgi:SAM-dependent methyltransferase
MNNKEISGYLRPNFERYKTAMNSSVQNKLEQCLPHLEFPENYSPIIASIGAGTRKLEELVAKIVPNSKVIAFDTNVRMFEDLGLNDKSEDIPHNEKNIVFPIVADGQYLPLAKNSLDRIIALSVFHEIASFRNNYQYGETIKKTFSDLCLMLKPGGQMILRDFVQPKDVPNEVIMTIDDLKQEDNGTGKMNPLEFIEKFTERFKGDDLSYLKDQIAALKKEKKWKKGVSLLVKTKDITEIAAHYSWSRSFDIEIEEKYSYFPVSGLANFILNSFSAAGTTGKIVTCKSYLQNGYKEQISGRLDFKTKEGKNYPLPDFTGIVVVEKVK